MLEMRSDAEGGDEMARPFGEGLSEGDIGDPVLELSPVSIGVQGLGVGDAKLETGEELLELLIISILLFYCIFII